MSEKKGEEGFVRLRIDKNTEILVRPENATNEYVAIYKKRLLKKGLRVRRYERYENISDAIIYIRSVDFRYGVYEDLERRENVSEQKAMGVDKK